MKENRKRQGAFKIDIKDPNWKDVLRKHTEEEFQTNEKIREYLQQFEPGSVKTFIDDYIKDKIHWYEYSDYNTRNSGGLDLYWIKVANTHLENIQQKKLFDLQCEWRAEKIELPSVEISFDFVVWGEDILNCPFLPPVTEEEVDLYKQYLAQEDAELHDTFDSVFIKWQDYRELKKAWETSDAQVDFPGWYDFHNNRTGASMYLLLPDVRGQKEAVYLNLFYKAGNEKYEKQQREKGASRDKRPHLFIYDATRYYVEHFEDIYTKKYYNACKWSRRNKEELELYSDMVETLMDADVMVPMVAHRDWREGLRKTVDRYKAAKIIEAMDEVLVQYELNRSMNIAFPQSRQDYSGLRETFLENILTGRRLNGEPEDLNF